eukprot:15483668-Alexandrium_andersonii.AAC.1
MPHVNWPARRKRGRWGGACTPRAAITTPPVQHGSLPSLHQGARRDHVFTRVRSTSRYTTDSRVPNSNAPKVKPAIRPRPVSAAIRPNPQSAMRKAQNRSKRSNLELRGTRNGLKLAAEARE